MINQNILNLLLLQYLKNIQIFLELFECVLFFSRLSYFKCKTCKNYRDMTFTGLSPTNVKVSQDEELISAHNSLIAKLSDAANITTCINYSLKKEY